LNRLGRPEYLILAAIAAAVVATIVLVALGLDALSLVLGGAVVAASMVAVVVVSVRPIAVGQRRARRRHTRLVRQTRQGQRRTRRQVIAAERRLFWQLEALGSLRDELDLKKPLGRTRGAAASPDLLYELVRIIDRTGAKTVVETGSGISTVVMAARLKAVGGKLVALEHHAGYAEATRRDLEAQGLQDVATVLDTPLVDTPLGEESWAWYDLSAADVPADIDLLFVDGPPGREQSLARYPAFPLLRDRLAPGATILVDDAIRPDEQKMVERWRSEADGMDAETLDLVKGAIVLTMPT
jgi:predicted O-methyltransferase YrrM